MRFNIFIRLFLAVFVLANLWWQGASCHHSMPCPTFFAGALERPLMDWLIRTQTKIDRLGLRTGQHLWEIGVGPTRLLIPDAQQVLPGGDVVELDIQPGMIERLSARHAGRGFKYQDCFGRRSTAPISLREFRCNLDKVEQPGLLSPGGFTAYRGSETIWLSTGHNRTGY